MQCLKKGRMIIAVKLIKSSILGAIFTSFKNADKCQKELFMKKMEMANKLTIGKIESILPDIVSTDWDKIVVEETLEDLSSILPSTNFDK